MNIDKFKAVIFDLDSTLMDTHRYPLVASEWLLKNSNVDADQYRESYLRNLISRYFKAIEAIADGAPFRPPFDIVKASMSNSLTDIGFKPDPDIVEEATQRFRSLHIELSTPFPGVPELLSNLEGRGIRQGILTNGFVGNSRVILDNSKLRHHFKAIVDCGDVQAYKPMPELFERTLALLDAIPSETLFVGDEYYADMVGAKRLQITTVWVNHREDSLDELIAKYGPENTPDYVTKTIAEFAEML
ncbi:MAG: HAD family hydrolase [Candidatus Thorarchaeota archaeon]